jgi:predicted CopG family antitoxin
MNKELTIIIDEKIYEGLYRIVNKDGVSQFIENLLRPYVMKENLEVAYQQMAMDKEHESNALEWSEAMIGDIDDEAW